MNGFLEHADAERKMNRSTRRKIILEKMKAQLKGVIRLLRYLRIGR